MAHKIDFDLISLSEETIEHLRFAVANPVCLGLHNEHAAGAEVIAELQDLRETTGVQFLNIGRCDGWYEINDRCLAYLRHLERKQHGRT